MKPDVLERIARYRPRTDRAEGWDELRPIVLGLAKLSDPPSAKNASATMSAITGYVLWAKLKGIPLVVENLANYTVIDWHLTDAGYILSTEATYRSTLYRMVDAARPGGPAGARRPVLPPYTAAQRDQLLALEALQPTEASSLRVSALLRAGLGAGPTPTEMRYLRPEDVVRDHGVVTLLVGRDDTRRSVPVLSSHAEPLWELSRRAEELAMPYLVTGAGSPDNPSTLSDLTADVNGSSQAPRILASRLRTTWLVTHLQARTPLDVLLPAAGDVSVARLADLFVHLDPRDPAAAASLLASADHFALGESA